MMDLQTVIENTPRILGQTALYGTLAYPIYVGLRKAVSPERKFKEIFKEQSTHVMVGCLSAGYLCVEYAKLFFNK
jgi:hypothetical protein